MSTRRLDPTQDASEEGAPGTAGGASQRAEPGLLLIFSSGRPAWTLVPLGAEPVELGRGQGWLSEHEDPKMSRQHAQVSFSTGRFGIVDLGSRNGSALDGVAFEGAASAKGGQLLRLGHSLFLCCTDLRPFRQFRIKMEPQRVEGALLQQALSMVTELGAISRTLFITGESGAGKEFIAHAYHRATPERDGPFIAVNCAAIPEGVAERLLFGSRKGAFSGAASDSQGYIEAADGGTLFLDEIADLDMVVQGKLLRVIESGELLPLGATRPKKVRFRVCTATHKDLREQVKSQKFRADLYFRIGMPQVTVPPLRERKEEIPFLIEQTIQTAAPNMRADVSLVEICLLRPFPGNVRELKAEIIAAALMARSAGRDLVTAAHLRKEAGAMMDAQEVLSAAPQPLGEEELQGEAPSRAQILAALLAEDFNIAAAARSFGLHRTQLRRLLVRHNIDLGKLRAVGKDQG